jgi:hypothetical protein
MATIGSTNISFNGLKVSWGTVSYIGGSDPGSAISLDDFRGGAFTDGTSVPARGEISIDDFKNKTFGKGDGRIYNTDSFQVYSTWSASPTILIGTTADSTYSGSETAYKRVELTSPQAVTYGTILVTPNAADSNTSPGIIVDRSNDNVVSEVTLWLKTVSATWSAVQWGLIAKDMILDNWSSQLQYMDDRHGSYRDALRFHGYGFHNFAGSRDDITSSSTIVSPQYKNDTYGTNLTTNFHNIIGKTAGTIPSSNVTSGSGESAHYFYGANYRNYLSYRGPGIDGHNLGMKVKWYSTTIQANIFTNSNIITPVSSSWSTSDLTNVFSGMYVSGTGIPETYGCFIGDIHTNYMELYRERGVQTLTTLNASARADNVTLTISGYLYWTLATTDTYSNPVILGPPHTVLPRYQAISPGSNTSNEITEWGMFIGDTNNTNNTFEYDIRNTDPTGTTFDYSVVYGTGTVPFISWKYSEYINSSYISQGNKSTNVQSVTFDLSGSGYAGCSVIGYMGMIVFKYISGSSFTGDIQILEVTVNGVVSNIGEGTVYPSWQRNNTINIQTYPPSDGWESVPEASNDQGEFARRTAAGTPSGSTGVDPNGGFADSYIYFEASTAGYANKTAYLRGPLTRLTSNSITVRFFAYGAAMGTLYAGVELFGTIMYEFAINSTPSWRRDMYVISSHLSYIYPISSGYPFTSLSSANINWRTNSMGARIQFLVAGQVVALGAQCVNGGYMSIFPDGDYTAAAGPVSVAGTNSTSTTLNYRYTTLTTPLIVAANSIYRTSFTNPTGGYGYHIITTYYGTDTDSGNMTLISGVLAPQYEADGTTPKTSTIPIYPSGTNSGTNYGATDLIFVAD